MNVTEHGFFEMTRRLRDVADVFARGRVSFPRRRLRPERLAAPAVAHSVRCSGFPKAPPIDFPFPGL
jgi:hypothetical protein